jgi:hypothetical protein
VSIGVNRFFWPQELLDQWIVDEKILLEGDKLTLAEGKRDFKVSQAVYFVADVGDGQDLHELVGRVKEISTLEEMGAEHYMDSVLLGDSAYQVVPGFTGEPAAKQAQNPKSSAPDIAGAISSHTGEEEADDRELLARFLLDNL